MTQAIRLLSNGPFAPPENHPPPPTASNVDTDIPDPFTAGSLTYTTTGVDTFPSPSSYANRRHAWVHIFPEGKIHQHPQHTMRYFKWGVSRLILEAEPAPDIVPMWIEGMDGVLHENRQWPRGIPRPGNDIRVTFGDVMDGERLFGDLRERWRRLKKQVKDDRRRVVDAEPDQQRTGNEEELGVLRDDELRTGVEAVKLREECTLRMRQEVLKVRRQRRYPDEDPKCGLVDTWREEGGKREGQMKDGSWVKDT